MTVQIRKMQAADKDAVISMMRVFYASPAVHSNGSEAIFQADFDECTKGSPYAEGYAFDVDGELAGYGMLAFGYSTEFGKRAVWIEDVYVLERFRGQGIGSAFLKFVEQAFPECLIRLEVEHENGAAMRVYQKSGFKELPYLEMYRNAKA